uniref:Uncharacterized protein n=1 Tax=Lepeophtheirus salmonis TaxID=72036 RepID=A0A0K2SYY1_LEPSM
MTMVLKASFDYSTLTLIMGFITSAELIELIKWLAKTIPQKEEKINSLLELLTR